MRICGNPGVGRNSAAYCAISRHDGAIKRLHPTTSGRARLALAGGALLVFVLVFLVLVAVLLFFVLLRFGGRECDGRDVFAEQLTFLADPHALRGLLAERDDCHSLPTRLQ